MNATLRINDALLITDRAFKPFQCVAWTLHEGNGDIWLAALDYPERYAGWIMIEEKAEGGDMLAHIARERPSFLDGYTRVCEAAGVALYRRQP